MKAAGRLRMISPAGGVSTPALAWGYPALDGVVVSKRILYGTASNAILQVALP